MAGLLVADWQDLTGVFVSKGSNIINGDIGASVDASTIVRDEIKEVDAVESVGAWG